MKKIILISCLLFMPFLPLLAQQNDGDEVVIGKYRIIDSKILGEQRRILVNLPTGYESVGIKYPVVFHLYGDFVMTYFAQAASFLNELHSFRMIPGVILVGVDNTDRYRDLRPLKSDGSPGGADKFAQYIRDELIPFIDQNYRTTDFRILVGPQAGACFGFYTLMEHPDLFHAYILENSFDNPQRIDDYLIAKAQNFFTADRSLPKYLCMKTDKKSPNYPFSIEQQAVIEKNTPRDFRYRFITSDHEDYMLETGFMDGFKDLYSGYSLPDSITFGGLDSILKYYDGLSKRIGYKIEVSDHTLHFAASRLNGLGRKADARKTYEYILKVYPKSLDGLFQMGMIHSSEGNYEKAIECYNEFLAIRPQESIVRNALKRTERIINESAVYEIEKDMNTNGMKSGKVLYQILIKDNPKKKYFDENEFNAMGYRLLSAGKTNDAIEVFMMARESFPQSFNIFDSLGEAYLKAGNKKLSRENYQKSLDLNPKNENARKMLEVLKKK